MTVDVTPESSVSPERPVVEAAPEVASWRLIATLGLAGALAGFLLVFVYQATAPMIAANKARALRDAVRVVLKEPERFEARYVLDGALYAEDALPEGTGPGGLETLYLGFDAEDEPVGFAIVGGAKGYADDIRLIFGYDPRTKTLLGMKVLESKETPGLGDVIEKDASYYGQFDGATHPIQGVKAGQSGDDPHKVDMVTGATISSRTVINIVKGRLETLAPVLDAWATEQGR